jgi:hypothetical protein
LPTNATYSLTADFRDDVLASIGLGKISPKQAEEILKANRIGKQDIAMIRSGRYKKYEPSDSAKRRSPRRTASKQPVPPSSEPRTPRHEMPEESESMATWAMEL